MPVTFLEVLNHRDRVRRAKASIELALSVSNRPIASTKFGPYSAVLLHLVASVRDDVPVLWVDTGYNTRATMRFAERLRDRLALDLRVFAPRDHVITVPPGLDEPEHAHFVEQVKLEPFRRALDSCEADVWFTSLRREGSAHRASLETFSEGAPGVAKVAPLLDWTEDDVRRYLRAQELPVGPECYDPTKGEPMRECGLHTCLSA